MAFSGLHMAELITQALRFAGQALEVAFFIYLFRRGHWKRLWGVVLYAAALLTVSGARSYALHIYGMASHQYAYCFYLTDFLLALAAFLLVCIFFRRACLREEKLWPYIRLLLVSVFILVLGISSVSLSRNYGQIISRFAVEFEQNLYFTCLVLNTMLYLLLQQIKTTDSELELLVCGMGIQFAGPAAGWALVTLTPGQSYSSSLLRLILQLCFLGMILTWFYAIARMPKLAPARETDTHKRPEAAFAVPTV